MQFLRAVMAMGAVAIISACTTASTGDSFATPPEWLGKEKSIAKNQQMTAKGMIPISIDCMMDTTAKNPQPTYFLKIEYKSRPGVKWRWGVGETDEMQVHANTAKREGLRRIQSRQMLDPNSGKRASCALWLS